MSQLQIVSKEQAIKLKELGFNWPCASFWHIDNEKVTPNRISRNIYGPSASAPTTALALKWFRDVHGMYCQIGINDFVPVPYPPEFNTYLLINGLIHGIDVEDDEVIYDSYEASECAALDFLIDYLQNP